LIGGTIGLISGYYRRADKWLMRIIDVFMCFPYVLRAVAVVAIIGPGMTNLMLAVGTGSLPLFARLVRGSVLSKREEDYVTAAVALGAKDSSIIVSHILPNIIGPIIVSATLEFARAILSVAALSFLSLGIQPPTPEWGSMASSGRTHLQMAPHLVFVPSMAIFFLAMACNLIGDTLRDVLDPKLKDR
jgi:peptide/nickel transport system permease protein